MHLVIYIFVTFQVICNLCFKSSLYFCYISGHLYSVLQVISTWFYFRSSAFCASSHLYFVLFQVICNPCFKSSILCYISGHLHFVLLVIYTWLYFNSLRSVLLVIFTLLYFRSSASWMMMQRFWAHILWMMAIESMWRTTPSRFF